jgi:putative ATP-binding cassette transporter
LRASLTYPKLPTEYTEAEIVGMMIQCKLQHLQDRLDDIENWSQVLSPGEQQRVAFVRVFLHQPNWLFLDEATSALDEATQTAIYTALRLRLPELTVISIAHRESLKQFHQREYNLAEKRERSLP